MLDRMFHSLCGPGSLYLTILYYTILYYTIHYTILYSYALCDLVYRCPVVDSQDHQDDVRTVGAQLVLHLNLRVRKVVKIIFLLSTGNIPS